MRSVKSFLLHFKRKFYLLRHCYDLAHTLTYNTLTGDIIMIKNPITFFKEPLTRPHSEAKTWAPSSLPSAPQSAPPELAAQHKSQHSGYKSPESESVSLGSFSGINGHKDLDSERDSPLPTNAQDIPTKDDKVRNYTSLDIFVPLLSPSSLSHTHNTNRILSFKCYI